jgi:hypothetical protein
VELRDIARTRGVATAGWVAKTLQYPATNPQLSGPALALDPHPAPDPKSPPP